MAIMARPTSSIRWICQRAPAMPPNTAKSIHSPVISSTATAAQTQGKKRAKTPRHRVRRAGGSSWPAATGRSTIQAKNMPPTQRMAAITCRVMAMAMGSYWRRGKGSAQQAACTLQQQGTGGQPLGDPEQRGGVAGALQQQHAAHGEERGLEAHERLPPLVDGTARLPVAARLHQDIDALLFDARLQPRLLLGSARGRRLAPCGQLSAHGAPPGAHAPPGRGRWQGA